MGYYTLHKISIINKYNSYKNLQRLWKIVEDVSGYEFNLNASYLIDDTWKYGYGTKQYDFDSDIYEISEKLPKFKILVEAEEENGNTWEICVKGGHDAFDYEESESDENEESNDDEDSNENEEEDEDESNNENDLDEADNHLLILGNFENLFKLDDNEIFRR